MRVGVVLYNNNKEKKKRYFLISRLFIGNMMRCGLLAVQAITVDRLYL
jgi:hypothetical protein